MGKLRDLPKVTLIVCDRDLSVVLETVFMAITLYCPIQKSNKSHAKMQIFRFRDIRLCDRGIYHISRKGEEINKIISNYAAGAVN